MCDATTTAIRGIVTSEDLQLLADIGFIAVSRNLPSHAERIFNAILLLRPDQEAGYLGRAMVHLVTGRFDAAVKELRSAPRTVATNVYLGIALVRLGDVSEGRKVLQKVAATQADTPFRRLALEILADTFQLRSYGWRGS